MILKYLTASRHTATRHTEIEAAIVEAIFGNGCSRHFLVPEDD